MSKSPDAFRTISEVAEALDTPSHVLRFWETRFPQIRPVKRAGGRRYYRPTDVALLSGIKRLLHEEGLTIRGVQKILREQGVRHVASLAAGFEALDEAAMLAAEMATMGDTHWQGDSDPADDNAARTAQIIALQSAIDASMIKPLTAPPEDAPEAPMEEWALPESAEITPLRRGLRRSDPAEDDAEPAQGFTVTRIGQDGDAPLQTTQRSLDNPAAAADGGDGISPTPTLAHRLRSLRPKAAELDAGTKESLSRLLARAIRLRDHLATAQRDHRAGRE